jgi:acyl dehydratase
MSKTIIESPSDLYDLVGTTLGPSPSMEITQERINQFADATGDHQWIHIDAERAATGPFGATIAHGYLTMSLAAKFMPEIIEVRGIAMGVNYGTEKIRFPSPVTVGSKLSATGTVVSVEESSGGIKMVLRIVMQAEGAEKPACIVDAISVYFPA